MSTEISRLVRLFNERVRDACPEGYILHGSVVRRHLVRRLGNRQRRYGPYYLWTRKVDGKTVTLALSKEQAAVIAEAVARNRTLDRRLSDLRALSETIIRAITPSLPTRKRRPRPA